MEQKQETFYSVNDLTLLYFQDVEYLISILNANGIEIQEELRGGEIIETLNKCYNKCVDLGYYEEEE